MDDRVTDSREQPFYIIDDAFLKRFGKTVGPNGIAVYNVLCMYANKKTGESWPSRDTISSLTGLSVRAISASLKKLSACGLITIEATNGGPNHYFIQSVPDPLHVVQGGGLAPRARGIARRASPLAPDATPLAPRAHEQELLTRTTNKNQEQEVAAAASAAPPPPVDPPSPPVSPAKPKSADTPKPKKAARQETPDETAYYAACVPALAEVCRVDLKVTGEWARCKKPLQALYHATVRPTPELLRQHYGTPDGYWYASDFRGKKGETPEPHFVQNTWGKATSAAPVVARASPAGGNGRQPRVIIGETLAELRQRREREARTKAQEVQHGI